MANVLNKESLRNLIQHNVDKGLIVLANTLEYSVTSLLDSCSVEIFMKNADGELEETRMWVEDGVLRYSPVDVAPLKRVVIYADGACKGNPGIGGWGAHLSYLGNRKEIYGGQHDTTNNRMELTAVIEALSCLKEKVEAFLYLDSEYVIKGIKEWLPKWKSNGWKSSNNKPIKNVDLWLRLDEQLQKHSICIFKVKGHSGDPGNDLADALANKGVDSVRHK